MKIERCFDGVLSGFYECLEEVVEWVFERSLQVLRVFQNRLRGVPRVH